METFIFEIRYKENMEKLRNTGGAPTIDVLEDSFTTRAQGREKSPVHIFQRNQIGMEDAHNFSICPR